MLSVEWMLLLLGLALATVPFVRGGAGRGLPVLLGLYGLFLAGCIVWSVRLHQREIRQAENARSAPREGRPGGFVTSDTCQSCHPAQHASWHRSFHRTMTQFPSPATVRGDFSGIALELEGQGYRFERKGDDFWVEMPHPEWRQLAADARQRVRPDRVERRISLLTGSHHMQTYWVPGEKGNLQVNVPFTYLFEDERWVPRNDTFLMDPNIPSFIQAWNANCIQCHATAGQPRADPTDVFLTDTRLAEAGIACEACHGPAEKHVQLNRNPLRRYTLNAEDKGDPSIVNPARLDHRASAQVCGQCHSIKDTPGRLWRDEGSPYRAGDDLEKIFPVVRPLHHADEPWFKETLRRNPTFVADRYWSDGMARVSGREFNGLVETPCYQKGTMSCLSCHSMHESDPNDQLAARMDTNQACLQCHSSMQVSAHTRHAADSSGSLCYNCHMPHTTYGLMKAIRSHTVDSPSVTATLRTGRPNACNLCHLDRTLDWTARQLHQWFGQPVPPLSRDERTLSAAALGLLRGDAGQRAVLAWHLGWEPARKASGSDWFAPYLAQLLEDPYSTVRYIAQRSLKRLPEFASLDYDYIGPPADRTRAHQAALAQWRRQQPGVLAARPAVMLDAATWSRLLRERDDKPMYLQE